MRKPGPIVRLEPTMIRDEKKNEAFLFVERQRGKSTHRDVVCLKGETPDELDQKILAFVEGERLVEAAGGYYEPEQGSTR